MRKTIILISMAGAVAIFSSTASKSPTLPLLAEKLGVGSAETGLIAAASTITGIIVNVLAGTLSDDLLGRRGGSLWVVFISNYEREIVRSNNSWYGYLSTRSAKLSVA